MKWQGIENKVLQAFDTLLDIPRSTISTEFRHRLREILKERYPDGMERSALRDLIEGKLGTRPIVPATAKRAKVNYALVLMDALETMKKEALIGSE